MRSQRQQPRMRRGQDRRSARYARRDIWYDPLSDTLPEFFVLDTEKSDIIPCENATHACALARKKNREFYQNQPGNWTRYVACYYSRSAFRMLELFEREIV